jgi:hypothetical protein
VRVTKACFDTGAVLVGLLAAACSAKPDFNPSTEVGSTAESSTATSAGSTVGSSSGGGDGGAGGVTGSSAGGEGGTGATGGGGDGAGGDGAGGDGAGGTGGGPCGNGVIDDDESCDDASEQCVDCAFTCPEGFIPAESYTACYGTTDGELLGTSFFAAASACASLSIGGQRARLPTPRTLQDLASLAALERPDVVFLGATDLETEATRRWIDVPDLRFSLDDTTEGWAVGEPADAGGEDCVVLDREIGDLLREARCGDLLPGQVVCELVPAWALEERCGDDSLDPGEECEEETELFGRTCEGCNLGHESLGVFYESPIDHVFFGVFNGNASKVEAATTCETLGARLATPDDPGDISVLRDVSGGNAGWLGASPLIALGYTWDSGEPFDFAVGAYPWAVGEPNSALLPLVMLGGELHDVDVASFATPCEIGDGAP